MSDRILVVDDEPEMLQVMNRMLTSKGYKVHGAINGESALTALEETMFDLVLCDLAMPPGMSRIGTTGESEDDRFLAALHYYHRRGNH